MSSRTNSFSVSQNFLTRPYPGIESLQSALENVVLNIGSTRYGPGNVSLPNDKLPLREASIEVFFDIEEIQAAAHSASIPISALRIACVIFGSVVTEARVLVDIPVGGMVSPLIVPIVGAPLITESPNGLDARVFLYLGERLDEDGLRPHIPGTWLAFSEFRISPYTALSRFSPTPLDLSVRKHFGLPSKCMTFVCVSDELLEAESLDEEVDVYVDVSILRLLQEAPGSPLSSYIQLDLVALTLSAIIQKTVALLNEPDGFEFREAFSSGRSDLGALCHRIAAVGGRTVDELVSAVQSNPGLVRSLIETYANTLETTSLALRDVS